MPIRQVLLTAACLSLAFCTTESVDLTGEWEGSASWVVDGEHKETPLRLVLSQNGSTIGGTVLWGDMRRDVTSASAKGPEVEIESSTTSDRFQLKGMFRNNALEGRFWIRYPTDREPFPGQFKVVRKP
jgi:hypothetical protein